MDFRKFCEEEWGGAGFIGSADTILNTPDYWFNSRYLGPGDTKEQDNMPKVNKLFTGKTANKKKYMGKDGDELSKVEKLFRLAPTYVIKNMKKKD